MEADNCLAKTNMDKVKRSLEGVDYLLHINNKANNQILEDCNKSKIELDALDEELAEL